MKSESESELERLEKEICENGCRVNDDLYNDLESNFKRQPLKSVPI